MKNLRIKPVYLALFFILISVLALGCGSGGSSGDGDYAALLLAAGAQGRVDDG